MYQLIVVVMQFCFAYPKNKPSIDKQPDQVTPPGVSKSIECKMHSGWVEDEENEGDQVVTSMDAGRSFNDLQSVDTNSNPSNASNETASSKLSGSPVPVPVPVPRNVNITVSYNPPPKSLYTSFDQLRSTRPNCFISSIIKGDGLTVTPGFAVKTTEIKSPEEVTGVKSPSPEAWKVAIDTGSCINWTQSKPKVNSPITRNAKEPEIGKPIPVNGNQLTDQLPGNSESTNHQPSTDTINNNHSNGLDSIQIVTKETIL